VAVYRDAGISGSKGRDQRPGFDAMHKDAARRRFDVVMAWSVDRLGRSLQDLCGFLSELHSLGIDLFLHQQGIDTTTPAGKAMFQMMGVFAEFERSMIRERVNAGIARAKADGKHCGRPFIDTKLEGRIRDALAAPGRPGLQRLPSSSASAAARSSALPRPVWAAEVRFAAFPSFRCGPCVTPLDQLRSRLDRSRF
jgi:DNA invertase Pin-like site-specific DNA recombinase